MQQALALALFLLVPLLALVWLCGLPAAWRGKPSLSAMSSLAVILWPILGFAFQSYYPHTRANDGDMALAMVTVMVSGTGIAGLIISLLIALIGKLRRKSKERKCLSS